jgi:glycosyltransferase involved in cell wall biosynthesis
MSIKVYIQTEKFKAGPAVFSSRLINSLKNIDGIEVDTNSINRCDIEIAFIRRLHKHNKPYILRVDGCYYEKGRESGNKGMLKSMNLASHIVFQSHFSFNLCNNILSANNMIVKNFNHSIVYNGIDFNYINKIEKNKKIIPGSFVACAGWRPNKRPFSMIKGFLKAGVKRHLYIIGGGKISKKYDSKYIHILGEMSNKKIISVMKSCDYQLHLCHIDSCPNAVIEGLSCGLNVLCTNLGGTKELVKDNGVVLNADKQWKGRLLKKTNLDNVKSGVVAEGVHKLLKIKERSKRPDLDINITTKKYVNIIKRALNV